MLTLMDPKPMDYEIEPSDLSKLRDQAQPFVLVDVREPWEFQTAKIEGSLLMPMGDVPGLTRSSTPKHA